MVKPEVFVTQPRRIAAISLAERVASEMNTDVGASVGFAVRFAMKRPNIYSQDGTICTICP